MKLFLDARIDSKAQARFTLIIEPLVIDRVVSRTYRDINRISIKKLISILKKHTLEEKNY